VSDLLFILGVYWGFSYISRLASWSAFAPVAGSIGALVLLGYGLYTLFTPPTVFPESDLLPRRRQWTALWLKGFLINTINPFTVFFWSSTMTGVVLERQLNTSAAILFFSGILIVIILTDTAKIALARHLRHWMRPRHFLWLRRIAGAAFVAFGLALAWRAWQ
jgi:threonine/homoserine/homoserine lactone efflux protein